MIPRNTIQLGDCIKLMQRLPEKSVDFVLTDPPYLVRYRDRHGRTVANDDNADWIQPAFNEVYRVLKPDSFVVSFYGWNHADKFLEAWRNAGFRIVGHLVFRKAYSSSRRYLLAQHENAYLLAKGHPQYPRSALPDILPWSYTGNRHHPTQKPLLPLQNLIKSFTKPGDLVLDPFCGSGSSLVAACRLKRDFLGMELDADHHFTSTMRLATVTTPG